MNHLMLNNPIDRQQARLVNPKTIVLILYFISSSYSMILISRFYQFLYRTCIQYTNILFRETLVSQHVNVIAHMSHRSSQASLWAEEQAVRADHVASDVPSRDHTSGVVIILGDPLTFRITSVEGG